MALTDLRSLDRTLGLTRNRQLPLALAFVRAAVTRGAMVANYCSMERVLTTGGAQGVSR